MAQLPSENYLVQLIDDDIVLFERYTERELVRFSAQSGDAVARGQKQIYDLKELSDEDKCFAHFWSGYFWAYGSGGL